MCVCFLFKIQSRHSDYMHPIVSQLHNIRLSGSVVEIEPFRLSRLLYPFDIDYFLYWGRCGRTPLMWLVCRNQDGISFEQLGLLKQLVDERQRPIVANRHKVYGRLGRQLFHCCPAVEVTNTTLSPVPLRMRANQEELAAFVDRMEEDQTRDRLAKWRRKRPTTEVEVAEEG